MKIIIDADACPKAVLQISFQMGKRFDLPVWTVASFNHQIESQNHIIVDSGSQQADLKVVNLTELGDLVITQDWGLAAICLAKGAVCLSPGGREYQPDRIDQMLEERELKARFRRGGGRTRGPKKRESKDDTVFAETLASMIKRLKGASRG